MSNETRAVLPSTARLVQRMRTLCFPSCCSWKVFIHVRSLPLVSSVSGPWELLRVQTSACCSYPIQWVPFAPLSCEADSLNVISKTTLYKICYSSSRPLRPSSAGFDFNIWIRGWEQEGVWLFASAFGDPFRAPPLPSKYLSYFFRDLLKYTP